MDISERRARGKKLLDNMLGESAERTIQSWRQICPDLEEYIFEFVGGEVWSRPGLDLRTKSLATVAALTALNRPLALQLNVRGAIANGATRKEVVETILQLLPYAGFPACWEALALTQKVFQDMDQGK